MDPHIRAEITSGLRLCGVRFAGIFYAHQLRVTIGQAVDELELACKIYDLADMLNVVRYLPLQ